MPCCGIKINFLKLCNCRYNNESIDEIYSIDYSHQTLIDIPIDIFQYERTLEILHLNANMIKELPRQLFYCQELKELLLCDNEIKIIPQAIGALINLKKLDLCRNSITHIADNIINCKQLKFIDLSLNGLEKLPLCICNIISLNELYINSTYLEYLPSNIGKLINLKIIEIRDNELIILPKSMPRLINLERLDIGDNVFTELPEVVGELKNLKELWIDDNCIRRLSSNIGNLINLIHLEASNNCLTQLPSDIIKLINLKELNLSSNEILLLPNNIGYLHNLVTLRCDENHLKDLPDSICKLENLEELMLSHNDIVRLPSSIGLLRKLRILTIDENLLHILPNELCSCTSLTILSVRGNKLTELPINIGHLTNLRVINIVNNFITHLPMSVLNLTYLSALWISDNQSKALMQLQKEYGSDQSVHLTCFMLPQTSASAGKAGDFNKTNNLSSIQTLVKSKQLYTMNFDEKTEHKTINKKRHICFATEPLATIIDQPVRLIRSPTPYPKELRVLSKYVKNTTKNSIEMDNFNTKTIIKESYESKDKVEIREARVATSNLVEQIYPFPVTISENLKHNDELVELSSEQNSGKNLFDGFDMDANMANFNNPVDYVSGVQYLHYDKILNPPSSVYSGIFPHTRLTDDLGAIGGHPDDISKIDFNLENSTSQYSSFRSTKELSEINDNIKRNNNNYFEDGLVHEGSHIDYTDYGCPERNKGTLEKNRIELFHETNDANVDENVNEFDRLLIDNNRQQQMSSCCGMKTITVNSPTDLYYDSNVFLNNEHGVPRLNIAASSNKPPPPPYHIAKAYTKKSVQDLLVYDNYRQNNDINDDIENVKEMEVPSQFYGNNNGDSNSQSVSSDTNVSPKLIELQNDSYETQLLLKDNSSNRGINNLSPRKSNDGIALGVVRDEKTIDDVVIGGGGGDNIKKEPISGDYVFMSVGKNYQAQILHQEQVRYQQEHQQQQHQQKTDSHYHHHHHQQQHNHHQNNNGNKNNNGSSDYVLIGINPKKKHKIDETFRVDVNYSPPPLNNYNNNNSLTTVEEIDEPSDHRKDNQITYDINLKTIDEETSNEVTEYDSDATNRIVKKCDKNNGSPEMVVELIGINDIPLVQSHRQPIMPQPLQFPTLKTISTKPTTTKPWLFGRHKNPKVIQTTIRKVPGLGFTLCEIPHQGLFIDKIKPNSPGAGILLKMDKILDVDGIDFTKLSYNRAMSYLNKNKGPVINIMISRK